MEPIALSIDRISAVRGLLLSGAYDVAAQVFPKETRMEGVRATPLSIQEEFAAEEQQWIGQSYTLPFPFPVEIGLRFAVLGCRARFGVSPSFLTAIKKLKTGDDFVDGFLKDADLTLEVHADEDEGTAGENPKLPANRQIIHGGSYASIRNGSVFISDWELLLQ